MLPNISHTLMCQIVWLILCLRCHWKQSQNGTMLKIAPCWLLTGSIHTAIIKMAQVVSILIKRVGLWVMQHMMVVD